MSERRVVSWDVGADNKLDFAGLLVSLDGTYPTDATVTVTVKKGANGTGAVVAGLDGVPATYVPGTSGPLVLDAAGEYVSGVLYRTLAATAAVTPPIGLYQAEAVATKGGIIGRKYATITVEKG